MAQVRAILDDWYRDPTGGDLVDVDRVLTACGYERRTSGDYSVYLRTGFPSWTFRANGRSVAGRVLQDFSRTMLSHLATCGMI
jgi:hypothetical protein